MSKKEKLEIVWPEKGEKEKPKKIPRDSNTIGF